jgi:hypothetical protein
MLKIVYHEFFSHYFNRVIYLIIKLIIEIQNYIKLMMKIS